MAIAVFAHVAHLSPRAIRPHRGCATPSLNLTKVLSTEKIAQANLAKLRLKNILGGSIASEKAFSKVIPVYFHGKSYFN
jgi:hypothetical protein